MRTGGGKSKGDAFERKIARDIGIWFCGDKDAFWRTSGSGARAHRDDIHPGDIGPVKNIPSRFPFCIECRNREAWSLDQLMKAPQPILLRWMVENAEVAGEDYLSLIIAKKNFYPPLAIFCNWYEEYQDFQHRPFLSLYCGAASKPSIYILKLDDFFVHFTKEIVYGFSEDNVFKNLKNNEKSAINDIKLTIMP